MKNRNMICVIALAMMSFPVLADSTHECQGNSCNGGEGGGTATAVSVAGASAHNRTDVEVTSVNVNSANAKGGSAYAKGGEASAGAVAVGGSQSVTVNDSSQRHYSGGYEVKNVPNPPDAIANPTAPCRVAVGVSGSGVGFGFGVGSSVLDEGCDAREDARLLYNMGMPDTAIQRLCGKPEMAKVIPGCATTKPAPSTNTPAKDSVTWNGSSTLY